MFTFAWPMFFLLLPLFWLVQRFWPYKKKKQEIMLKIPFLSRIKTLDQPTTAFIIPQYLRQFICIGIWVSLILACANPQWLGEPFPSMQVGRNIMLAIDLSPSMQFPDFQRQNQTLNRLQTVKEVASGFIEKRHGDKLGLILFGSKAYLQTPLTLDRKTVKTMLDDATIGLAGERTAIGDAIGMAVKKFSDENVKSRILILLTDGANNSGTIDPLKAAELAKENQIKIYTVGIGASQMLVSGMFGAHVVNPSADLDENMLKKVSSLTQGEYFRAKDEKALENILEAINQLEPVNGAANILRPITALFYWPLLVAFILICVLIFPTVDELRL